MHLDSINADALAPGPLGAFWKAALGVPEARRDGEEVALALPGGLELWFLTDAGVQPVRGRRVHLDLDGGDDPDAEVHRLLTLGARPLDIGQGDVEWTVLADPAGNAFCVLRRTAATPYPAHTLRVPFDSADPARDREFWRQASGWRPYDDLDTPALTAPDGQGPILEFWPEDAPKTAAKNWLHLDLRLDPGDDEAAEIQRLLDAGARMLDHDWGELDWFVLLDPSGNEFCVLRP